MSSPIKPLADRVVAVREKTAEKTASGIYLPESSKEKSTIATIVAVGPDVKQVKNNEKIVYKDYTATELKIDGIDYLVIKEEDILATV
jgi:chaperonin GroES